MKKMKIIRMVSRLLSGALLLSVVPALSLMAQDQGNAATESGAGAAASPAAVQVQTNQAGAADTPDITPVSIPSLLFNYWEQTALMEAKKSAKSDGVKSIPTDQDILNAMDDPLDQDRPKPPPEEREISLSGIAYTSQNDWTIWLNNERVTPDAVPKEIIDLKVYKHYIDMKWQDEYTRRLYPIRLRPHQRFNLDSRMFLPG
tara:strand:+ start:1515 stop:2120 length:606 start_codon:yes stop_codon:yes gene_type:complete